MVLALDAVSQIELHVVPQVIEAEFVVRAVRDVRAVRVAPLLVIQTVLNDANTQAEKLVKPAHPLRVAPRQVIVDGNDVNALAFECVQICRKRGNERFPLTGFHFRDPPLMQDVSADELHVEVPHVEDTLARLADDREAFRQNLLQRLAVFEALPEFRCFGLELFVGEAGNPRF